MRKWTTAEDAKLRSLYCRLGKECSMAQLATNFPNRSSRAISHRAQTLGIATVGAKGKTREQRFWERVEKTENCWLWTGTKSTQGYGYLSGPNGKRIAAHRMSYEIANGSIPSGASICHKCDNPRCVNPEHLWLGTQADNMADMAKKGRADRIRKVSGERHGQAKLTEDQVSLIRSAWASGSTTQTALAKLYGVSQAAIWYIVNGRHWAADAAPAELEESATWR